MTDEERIESLFEKFTKRLKELEEQQRLVEQLAEIDSLQPEPTEEVEIEKPTLPDTASYDRLEYQPPTDDELKELAEQMLAGSKQAAIDEIEGGTAQRQAQSRPKRKWSSGRQRRLMQK